MNEQTIAGPCLAHFGAMHSCLDLIYAAATVAGGQEDGLTATCWERSEFARIAGGI